MQNLICAFALAVVCGCASATRYDIKGEEATTAFVVRHQIPAGQAFNATELALAEAYNDLSAVLKLKQPESGTLILKPLVSYRVGGPLGPVHNAPYNLKIVVGADSITMHFELGRETTSGWNSWAPETEIPKIKAAFRAIAERVAASAKGTLEQKGQ
ncbi:MAG TPA: hypothetical protein VGF13_23330 [Verrucomicrobiae bacterium]